MGELKTNSYLLDSCAIIKLIAKHPIPTETVKLISDSKKQLFVSSISVHETIHFIKKNEKKKEKKDDIDKDFDIFKFLKMLGVKTLYVNKKALKQYVNIEITHNDPADHVIISQAISEGLTVVTCDSRFKEYKNLSLNYFKNIEPTDENKKKYNIKKWT